MELFWCHLSAPQVSFFTCSVVSTSRKKFTRSLFNIFFISQATVTVIIATVDRRGFVCRVLEVATHAFVLMVQDPTAEILHKYFVVTVLFDDLGLVS